MDRAQLDAAYNNLAAVTASAKLLADWAARSARFRERHRGHLGLAYGEQPRERLDLFLAGNPAAPTLAYIHGGYWQMTHQTKEMYSALAEGAVSHGLNVAVVEYTLAPEARMDRIVGEVRHAISWLHEHLGDYGADPGRIYVAGHSAGGHLAAMTMLSARSGAGSQSAASMTLNRSASTISMRSSGSTRPRRSATARCSISRRWQVR